MNREGGGSSLRAAFLVPFLLAALVLAAPAEAGTAVDGQLVVAFEEGVSAAQEQEVLARAAAVRKARLDGLDAVLALVKEGKLQKTIAKLEADPRVRYAEPNFLVFAADHSGVPNDPSFHELWGLDNFGQAVSGATGVADADVDAPEAWSVTTGSPGVVVGVIDTGVDFGHPDLAANMWINPGEDCLGCRSDGVDNDGNGYVDDWRGWDFVNNDNNPFDDNGHGTHVAGTIGAVGDNGVGVAGVNWNVKLMALKFLGATGSGTTANAVKAIAYASANGARVTNNSWSGAPLSQALLDAIAQADASDSLFVAAAGNDGVDTDTIPAYPSSFTLPNIVSVAATDSTDARAFFSNFGRRSVDLGAPGVSVYSTWPGDTYRYASGTSMATPHVAGAAALVRAAFPAASDLAVKALLLGTVDPSASLAGRTATEGRLNVGAAVTCTDAPQVWIEEPAAGFELDVGEAVTVTALAGRCAAPGGVTVTADANGKAIELAARGDGLYTGSYTAGAGGQVVISVSASSGGATRTRTVSGRAVATVPILPGGPAVTVTTTAPGENAQLAFAGVAGQRVSLTLSNVTIGTSSCCSTLVAILKPDGSSLVSPAYFGTRGGFVDTRTLPADGLYRILVDPQGDATGSMTLTLYDVPPDVSGAIAPGGSPVTVSTTTPGQNAKLTFFGTAGQRVSLALDDVTVGTSSCCAARVSIVRPNGTNLVSPTYVGTRGGFIDAKTLTTTGTHTIVVDPQNADTGGMTLTLYDVPADISATLALGGPAVTVTTTTPGQNAKLTFSGTAGRQVSLVMSAVTVGTSSCCGTRVSISKPDGTKLVSPTYVGTRGGTITVQLPVSGTYSVLVDPQNDSVGSMTLALTGG